MPQNTTIPKPQVQLIVNLAICRHERIQLYSPRVLIVPARKSA